MTKFIVITSGKGGVGKTTTALNLGTALSNFGREVIVIDGNLTTPNIGLHLGTPTVPITLNDALSGEKNIKETAYLHTSGLKVILANLSSEELSQDHKDKYVAAIRELKGAAEVIIIDAAASIGEEAMMSIDASDEVIIVTTPDLPAVISALKTIRRAEKKKRKISGVVVTRYSGDKLELTIKNIEELLEKPVIGIIPEDRNVKKALKLKHPLVYTHPESAASKSYKKLAANLIGYNYVTSINEEEPLFQYMLKRLGFSKPPK